MTPSKYKGVVSVQVIRRDIVKIDKAHRFGYYFPRLSVYAASPPRSLLRNMRGPANVGLCYGQTSLVYHVLARHLGAGEFKVKVCSE